MTALAVTLDVQQIHLAVANWLVVVVAVPLTQLAVANYPHVAVAVQLIHPVDVNCRVAVADVLLTQLADVK